MPSQEIDKLTLKVGVQAVDASVKKIDRLTTSLTELSTVLEKVSGYKNVGDFGISGGKGGKSTPRSKGGSSLFSASKIGLSIYAFKRLGSVVSKIAQQGADYTETLNLWETAMNSNLTVATKFVDKMNEAYGVSEKTLMNAQATFKNMLGSLGQISDETAYRLSEGVTQMALDYASLYNQTFEQSMYKFQAALAGQVRPIRSVSGFDITETTLFQLYRTLGGEKSMRQLTRTEKQLLSIYAIFQQMERSGTVGDLGKTMESYANQARVASEAIKEIAQYSGILLTYSIQQAGILQKLNGFLIFVGDVLKAVADEYNAIQHFGDPFEATTDGALAAYEATEKLSGKLLGFDKFRALNSSGDSDIGIDETLINALSTYESVLANAGMEAQNIAKALKETSGLFNEDGSLNVDSWNELLRVIKAVGTAIGVVFGIKSIDMLISFTKNLFSLKNAANLLNFALVGGIFYAFSKMIELFDKGNIAGGLLAGTIGVALVGAFVMLHKKAIVSALTAIGQFIAKLLVLNMVSRMSAIKAIIGLSGAFIGLGAAIAGAFLLIANWDDMERWQRIIGVIGVATTAVLGLALAFGAFHSAWSLGLATAGIAAGIAMITASIGTIKKEAETPVTFHANGGFPAKGSLFIAGEAGAELVTNMGGGQSGVMNMEQLENAVARGMYVGMSNIDLHDDRPIIVSIDGQKFFTASRDIYKRNGYDVSRVR